MQPARLRWNFDRQTCPACPACPGRATPGHAICEMRPPWHLRPGHGLDLSSGCLTDVRPAGLCCRCSRGPRNTSASAGTAVPKVPWLPSIEREGCSSHRPELAAAGHGIKDPRFSRPPRPPAAPDASQRARACATFLSCRLRRRVSRAPKAHKHQSAPAPWQTTASAACGSPRCCAGNDIRLNPDDHPAQSATLQCCRTPRYACAASASRTEWAKLARLGALLPAGLRLRRLRSIRRATVLDAASAITAECHTRL